VIPVTLIMAYYENAGMLQRHYDTLAALPEEYKKAISVIIVDDGSPKAHAYPPASPSIHAKVFRMRKDVRWNQDACRNIGVKHAETEWLLLTDMDHIVPLETWTRLLTIPSDPNSVYNFARVSLPDLDPYKMHPNSWFMTKTMYERAGGYDERFAGLYGTDGDFRVRLVPLARTRMIKEPIIRVPREVIPDASTTTYKRKAPDDKPGIKRILDERALLKDKTPLRGLFDYDQVWPWKVMDYEPSQAAERHFQSD